MARTSPAVRGEIGVRRGETLSVLRYLSASRSKAPMEGGHAGQTGSGCAIVITWLLFSEPRQLSRTKFYLGSLFLNWTLGTAEHWHWDTPGFLIVLIY